MAEVKVGTKNMPVPEKIQFARQVVIDMTAAVAIYATPAPTLAAITTAATKLETDYNAAMTARQLAKAKTATVQESDAALDGLLGQLANYVENTSGGDEAKIESSGFSVANVPAGPIGALPAPTDVVITSSEAAGTVYMRWQGVHGASSYVVERAEDAPLLTWATGLVTTKCRGEVNTMTSGTKYWFRVAAIGAAGQGPWSSAIAKFAT